jgi:hypothetical protein
MKAIDREGTRPMSDDASVLAAMSLLDQAGISFKRLDYDQIEVADDFILYAKSGYWRARPGGRRGYKVRELITEIKGSSRYLD